MNIKVLRPGALTSIQDLGRHGYQKFGVIVSGAMDPYSLRIANLLVGNDEGEGALEITLAGPSLMMKKDTLFAITGGDLSPTINGEPVPMWRPVYLKKDSTLQFGACKSGCRAYLAVAGGYDIPVVMGSKSTYLRAGLGGFQGRALKAGDVLSVSPLSEQTDRLMRQFVKQSPSGSFVFTSWYAGNRQILGDTRNTTVRVLRGTQYEHFDAESTAKFWSCTFKITPQSDRMGYRLSGPVLKLAEPLEMISEAVSFGTVQVPPDGNPIILLADRQTAGGYPKIAQVAMVDIPLVAQSKPGCDIRFQEISLAEAENLYVQREKNMQNLKIAVQLKLKS